MGAEGQSSFAAEAHQYEKDITNLEATRTESLRRTFARYGLEESPEMARMREVFVDLQYDPNQHEESERTLRLREYMDEGQQLLDKAHPNVATENVNATMALALSVVVLYYSRRFFDMRIEYRESLEFAIEIADAIQDDALVDQLDRLLADWWLLEPQAADAVPEGSEL